MTTPNPQQEPSTQLLVLPPSLSPDSLDVLTDLSTALTRVRAGLLSSTGISPSTTTPGGTLSFKEVPGATDGIKHKLQKARQEVRQLPDMERSLEQQEKEMRDLEDRIVRQKALLGRLREAGVQFGREGDKMEI